MIRFNLETRVDSRCTFEHDTAGVCQC